MTIARSVFEHLDGHMLEGVARFHRVQPNLAADYWSDRSWPKEDIWKPQQRRIIG